MFNNRHFWGILASVIGILLTSDSLLGKKRIANFDKFIRTKIISQTNIDNLVLTSMFLGLILGAFGLVYFDLEIRKFMMQYLYLFIGWTVLLWALFFARRFIKKYDSTITRVSFFLMLPVMGLGFIILSPFWILFLTLKTVDYAVNKLKLTSIVLFLGLLFNILGIVLLA